VIDAQRALDILLELTRQLLREPSLNPALTSVTDAALELLPGDHASIRVLDQSRRELLSGARSGIGRNKQPVRHVAGQGVAGSVIEQGELVRIGDAASDPRFVVKPNQGFVIRSMLAVPLWSAGEVVGVLAVTSSKAELYKPEHETLAWLLANCAVPPIEKARLARLAITDSQTLAFNHAFLMPGLRNELDKLRDTPGQLGLLLMDLDHFKHVNDRFGHASGDEVLRMFARTVRAMTRDKDILVRRGGDEFVLIMPGADAANAVAVAHRIHNAVRANGVILEDGHEARVTVSIGVASWDGHETAEELEKRADLAMYVIKEGGRDGVHVAEPPPSPSKETP
jgi:diguanylate cyclase (GGDEF)-like protein